MKRLNKSQSTIKKGRLLKWTYQGATQAQLIAEGMVGQSNKVIRAATKFSDNEVNYALSKYTKAKGIKGGLRRSWCNGTSDIVKQVKADLIAVLAKEIQDTTPQLFIHPTPETVKVKE